MVVGETREQRRVGRPPQTDEEQARARDNIVRATAVVFAEHGYHGMSVARILDQAQIARPTFYRYFRNMGEPLEIVLDRVGYSVVDMMEAAIAATPGDIAKVVAAIEAYLQWSRDNRQMLRSLFAGVHDASSPVSTMRSNAMARITELLTRELAAAGRETVDPWILDVMTNAIEYTCYRVYLDTEATEEDLNLARLTMLRITAAVIGSPRDWQTIFGAPGMLPYHPWDNEAERRTS